MSKLFFDNFLDLSEVEAEIKKTATSVEERDECYVLVDGAVTTWVLEKVFDRLPREHHDKFLAFFLEHPHDEEAVFGVLNEWIGKDIREELKEESKDFSSDILNEIRPQDEVSRETRESQVSKK